MSKDNLFDDIARILASPMPRRQAFRVIAGGLASGAVVSLLEPQPAHALAVACANVPAGTDCSNGTCAAGSTCMEFGGRCTCRQNCTTHRFNGTLGNCHTLPCPNDGECRDPANAGMACFCHPPYCSTTTSVFTVISGPPAQADVTIQNAVEGVNSITLTTANNCTVATAGKPVVVGVPLNEGGTTAPVVFVATKIDRTERAQFAFSVCGPDGLCCDRDPIFTVLKLTTGRWVRQTFADVPQTEQFVTMTSGAPGLNRLHIWVNSKHFTTLSLGDNETRSLDLAAAMTEKANTISLVGAGELGASASVLIGDIPPAAATKNRGMGAMALAQTQGSSPRQNAIWGPLAEETEENSHLHVANTASQTVQVNFNGALSSGAASNPSAFTVEVNGKPAAVQAVRVQAGAAGMNLTLQLPSGTLHSGDSVDVYWENLRNAKGRPLAGHVALFAH
jgi:hypothetical protein